MTRLVIRNRWPRLFRVAATLLLLLATGLTATAPEASAQLRSDEELAAQKADWQSRYRRLLTRKDELRAEIELHRELYADANRRNYRRGDVRHGHRERMLTAQAELAEVEAELATFADDARRAGALPGWLYEVEDEVAEMRRTAPAAADPGEMEAAEDEDEERDDGGRNPLYLPDADPDDEDEADEERRY